MRKIFFQTLEESAKKDKSIFILAADLGVKFFQNFKDIDSKRFLNVGVAEANMIDIAAGLAMSGKNVYCYSITPFLISKTLEQIKIDLCYNKLNVKLLGAGSGFIYGAEGVTHHALEDLAVMRSLPNMTIVAPGDALEAEALAKASVGFKGPLFIRFGRDIDPVVHEKGFHFEIGKGIIVNEGKDICLIAIGTMLYPGKLVCDILKKQGLNPTLISMHTLKPLDEKLIEDCAKKYKAVFTFEEHNIIGGLGSAVAEVLVGKRYSGIFHRFGIPDKFSADFGIGGPNYLLEKIGLTPEKISETIFNEIKKI
ncbi:MAG: hypothetical protein ISS83_02535 [Candidatus Pacebacteria bacterium]|nr:hypothetical protein [Candidatus Paceibacterota bacterium]